MMGFPLKDLPDACIFLDEKDRIVSINPAGEKLLALVKADVVGKTLAEVCSGRAVFLTSNGSLQDWCNDSLLPLIDGLSGHAQFKVSAVQSPDGKPLGR